MYVYVSGCECLSVCACLQSVYAYVCEGVYAEHYNSGDRKSEHTCVCMGGCEYAHGCLFRGCMRVCVDVCEGHMRVYVYGCV
jgi:hypothetical protein